MRYRPLIPLLVLLVCWSATGPAAAGGASSSSPTADLGFCKPYTWLFGGWVAPPRVPMLGDVNGDGFADYLTVSPQDGLIEVSLNGRGWKPLRGSRLLPDLPQAIASSCLGRLGGKTRDVAILGQKGGLYRSLSNEKGEYEAARPMGTLTGLTGRTWLLAGRVVSGETDDLILVCEDGQIRVLEATTGKAVRQYQSAAGTTDAAAGDVDGDGVVELALRTKKGVQLFRLGDTLRRLTSIRSWAKPRALAMGDVNADGKADLLVDGVVHLGADFRQSVAVEGWGAIAQPVIAFLADMNGDKRADVVVQLQGKDAYGSKDADCNVYLTYRSDDADWDADGLTNDEEAKLQTDPLDRDTDYDGLCDGWEVHGFRGFDFAGMGASPRHKDIFVLNQLYDNVPQDQADKVMKENIVPFYASIPYTNLDGTKGFAIHFVDQMPPYPSGKGKPWWDVADEVFPKKNIGTWHWMEVTSMGGGGQSGQLADAGSGGIHAWIHEFGHQLGCSHSGKWAQWSPTYHSLMTYFYGGRFSSGELASVVLNETRLSEKLPFPIEKLKVLSGPPYRFRLKEAGKDATYVDWNWNGVFEDTPVRANITYGYSASGGARYLPSGPIPFRGEGPFDSYTDLTPELALHKGEMYLLIAQRGPLDPKAPRPSSYTLTIQKYQGNESFGPARVITSGVTNDPCAVSDGTTFYVFYATERGIEYRFGRPDRLSDAYIIPATAGMYVRAVNWKGSIYAFLYGGPEKSIEYCTVAGIAVGPRKDLGIKSSIPPGPAVDTVKDQLLLGTADTQGTITYRWQLRRFRWDEESGGFRSAGWEWLGGLSSGWRGNKRPVLIFDTSADAGPQGRVYFFGRGLPNPPENPAGFFAAMNIAYKDINDGWLLRFYYDEWTNSHTGVGAVWYGNDIVLANTWTAGTAGGDDGVYVAYHGTGIQDIDTSDFDDVSHMANYGIARSIQTFATMPEE